MLYPVPFESGRFVFEDALIKGHQGQGNLEGGAGRKPQRTAFFVVAFDSFAGLQVVKNETTVLVLELTGKLDFGRKAGERQATRDE